MKTIFEETNLNEILQRLDRLQPDTQRKWGTMTVSQMLAHCSAPIEVSLGERQASKSIMSVLLGPFIKKMILSEKPFKQGLPTDPNFVVKDDKNFQEEKEKLVDNIKRFAAKKGTMENPPKHPFLGKLTYAEWSRMAYKHLDHHLQQFGS